MPVRLPIYLDYHATTPVDPRVLEAMLPYFTERFGNAASRSHIFGWDADAAVERARAAGGCPHRRERQRDRFHERRHRIEQPRHQRRAARAPFARPRHVITTASSTSRCSTPARALRRRLSRDVFPVDSDGRVDPAARAASHRRDTVLVSVMAANNEVASYPAARGDRRDHAASAACCCTPMPRRPPVRSRRRRRRSASTCSRSPPTRCTGRRASARSTSAGGARIALAPILEGGGQERGVRSGTLNVPGIVGLGRAAEINAEELRDRIRAPRRRCVTAFRGALPQPPDVGLNGSLDRRLPHNLSVHFAGVPARVDPPGRRRHRAVLGVGVLVRDDRAIVRAEGVRHPRRPGALVHPLRPRPVHDGGGDRLRGRKDHQRD